EPLIGGQTYYAGFYANAAWGGTELPTQMGVASSHVGMLFTMQPRPWQVGQPQVVLGNFAHVYHPWIIADTVGWTLVSGSFVADSAYRYLMIGNHFDDANTDTLHFATYIWNQSAYTLIDNVCVSPNPLGCPLGLGVADATLGETRLYPNPARNEISLTGVPRGSRVTIHDVLGRTVWQEDVTGGVWRKEVSAWARGGYLLRMERSGSARSFKFVLTE